MNTRTAPFPLPRRRFLQGAATTAAAVSILPARILGAAGRVSPNSKLTLAAIGTGGQGLQNVQAFLEFPEVQVVAVCDVNREGPGYISWSWDKGKASNVAGREPARRFVDEFYGKQQRSGTYRGCKAYTDYRELLAQEDVDAVREVHVTAGTRFWGPALFDGRPPAGMPVPDGLEANRATGHTYYVGDQGILMGNRLIPESKMAAFGRPTVSIPPSPGHYKEFVDACRGGPPAGANLVDHAGLLSEACALGNVALRAGRKLAWDGPNFKVTNDAAANRYLHREYRAGWSL